MLSQEKFVAACFHFYKHCGFEPGNPFHGEWEKAHYPVPRRLGGGKCVWLLKNHHAIQGVIQSEEFNICCVAWWEKDYLPRFYIPYYEKWRHQHQVENAGKFWAMMDEGEKKSHIQKMVDSQSWSEEDKKKKAKLLNELRSDPILEGRRVENLVRRMGHKVKVIECEKIQVYSSIGQAARALSVTRGHLHKLMKDKEKIEWRGVVIERVR